MPGSVGQDALGNMPLSTKCNFIESQKNVEQFVKSRSQILFLELFDRA